MNKISLDKIKIEVEIKKVDCFAKWHRTILLV